MTNMIHNDQIYQVTHPQCPTTRISLLDLRNIINLLPQTNSSPPLVTKVFSQCNILSLLPLSLNSGPTLLNTSPRVYFQLQFRLCRVSSGSNVF